VNKVRGRYTYDDDFMHMPLKEVKVKEAFHIQFWHLGAYQVNEASLLVC